MVNKYYDAIEAGETFTDPGGTVHTGSISGDGGGTSGASWSHSGELNAQSDVILYIDHVDDGVSFGPTSVTAIDAHGMALPSNTSMMVGWLDSAGSFSQGNTIISGDGSSRYVQQEVSTTWTNETGSPRTSAIIFRNNRDERVNVFTHGGI